MTTQQLHLFNCLYLVMLIAVAILTRATPRRIEGALAGAAVGGVAGLGIIAFGERAGWWHMAITWEPYFLTLLWIDVVLCAYLIGERWMGRRHHKPDSRQLAITAGRPARPHSPQRFAW